MKITLLGDSIRMNYTQRVTELLGDGFEVYSPNDNGRFSKYTLRGLFDWEKDMEGSRIVHWNNGLWDITRIFEDDIFTSKEEYLENMLRIAKILTSRYDKVIFATTTPNDPTYEYNQNSDIEEYNALLVPKLQEMGIIINDLYSVVYPHLDEYICEDKIHLSEAGIKACAKQVAKIIKETAAEL
jgi:lysophospholipase L1-like esterase